MKGLLLGIPGGLNIDHDDWQGKNVQQAHQLTHLDQVAHYERGPEMFNSKVNFQIREEEKKTREPRNSY